MKETLFKIEYKKKNAMRKYIYLIFSVLAMQSVVLAQSTALEVYNLMGSKCATSGCHVSASPAGGLDLEGVGASTTAQALDVYNNVFEVAPANGFANAKGYKYIYPGRTDKSYLFRAINEGFETSINLDAQEGVHPTTGLDDEEKELIRQWIQYGAPAQGTVVDTDLIADYYNVNGEAAFPDGPPPAPAANEGFQIKMGPFLLEPGGELEYFQKYELDLPEDVEVNRIDILISNYSHHFLIYDFNPNGSNNIPPGLRLDPDHSNIGLVTAVQDATDLKLPEGTAFKWEEGLVLDLNTHYINYSSTNTYLAEAYVNVYTQPLGTAVQEMKTELIANFNIFIPNNGNMVSYNDAVNYNLGEVYLWGIMGHTHKYGRDYKVYKREAGQKTDIIYDASCPQGTPGCVSPFFDYQHIPIRYVEPFIPINMNFANGLIHEASWVNDGPSNVGFGATSDDEMMVLVLMYLEDITGLPSTTSTQNVDNQIDGVQVFPNPFDESAVIALPKEVKNATIRIFDTLGKEVKRLEQKGSEQVVLKKGKLKSGMYLYRVENEDGRYKTGKIVVE